MSPVRQTSTLASMKGKSWSGVRHHSFMFPSLFSCVSRPAGRHAATASGRNDTTSPATVAFWQGWP
jgi:hypothetical protein